MKIKFCVIVLLILIMPVMVFAHPGRTDSSGCHTCKTNCARWGLSYGEYHCHNGSSNSSSSSSYNNQTESYTKTTTKLAITTTQKPKSSDTTLKEIIIDDESLEVEDELNYKTKNDSVNIEVITNDDNATYEIINGSNLSIGENKAIVVVKAEDGTIKNYVINITREVILSSNTDVKILINDTEVDFEDYKATIYLTNSDTKIDLDYELDDEKSKIEYNEIEELKVGDNNLKIKVIAEDGSQQIYSIVINRATKAENNISNVVGYGLACGVGYGVYKLFKKRKNTL